MTETRWDEEAGVVVIGYGGAGAVAAIAAHDAGAGALIIEKNMADTATVCNHTPGTRISGGAWMCPDDPVRTMEYLRGLVRIAGETMDAEREALLKVFAERMCDNTSWMRYLGAKIGGSLMSAPAGVKKAPAPPRMRLGEYAPLPGSDACYLDAVIESGQYRHGAALFKVLVGAIQKRRIPVSWGTAARHLVVEDGAVRGVIVERQGKPAAIRATRGVILACGGFEFNPRMRENYLRPSPIYFCGNPGNTGDGITMAQEIGADLWHMNCISFRGVIKVPDFPIGFSTQHHDESCIWVDKRGSRFTNERCKMHSFGYELAAYDCYAMCYPRVPVYWIFDEKRRRSGPVASYHGICNAPGGLTGPIFYCWSEDNQVEIDKGWIMKAGTLEDLGKQIAADPDDDGLMDLANFFASVRRYNELCRRGEDVDFHRPTAGLAPLEDPPYYAVKLWPGGPNTQGGPRRNPACQVVRTDGRPVPRLYAAGELGSVWAMLYNTGGNLGENIALGRLAGENAATEKAWK